MFGFFKLRNAVNASISYSEAMFAGLHIYGKNIPNQAFGDPYVIGFLQQLSMHAVNVAYGKAADAKTLISVFEATMDRLVPGIGKQIVPALIEVNRPEHPANLNYSIGSREGGDYIKALLVNDVIATQKYMVDFRTFIKKNYLGVVE